MTQTIPTSDSILSERTPQAAPKALSRFRNLRLWPLMVLFVLLTGVASSRAASAVVTFTNFPPAVSNTYNGIITLQINGLTNGVTNVIVQKYLDVDTNRILDKNAILIQQFQLTAGQASTFTNGATVVTVTNFMPGDMSTTPGQITAPLNFQNGDFVQTLVGQYFYKISSPSGQFTSSTNLFTVTNFFYSSAITGAVQYAGVTNDIGVSNAIVLLCVNQSGSLNVQAGAVADVNGNFTIRAPAGNYFLAAAKTNFVIEPSGEPSGTLVTNITNGVSITLIPSTTSITGRVVDATSAASIPGVAGMLFSTNNFLSLYFTDTNGYFKAPAVTNSWVAEINPFAATFNSYLTPQTNFLFGVSNKVVHITNQLTHATAIFYGVITNNSGAPMPGVYISASDNKGHLSYGMTDQRGNYVVNALAGTNLWQLSIQPTNNPGLTNFYVFSPGYIQTNIPNVGQAVQVNFSLALAPYNISGTVSDINGNPIGGVQVFGVSSDGYQAFNATTTASGFYSLNVSPTFWTVGVSSNSLASLGFHNVPDEQSTNLSAGVNATINFSVLVCGQIGILTTNLSNAMIGSYYETNLQAISCANITNWSTAYGVSVTSLYGKTNLTYPPGTAIYSDGKQVGYLESYFSFGLNINVPFATNVTCTFVTESPVKEDFNNLSATVNVSGPITNNNIGIQFGGVGTTWTAHPTTQNGSTFTTTLTLNQYSMTYNGKVQKYTATNGMFMTASKGTSNTVASLVGLFHSLPVGNSINLPSTIPYLGSNNASVWIKSGTNLSQYLISVYGAQNTNLPPGMNLYPDGTFAGTPTSLGTNNGLFNFDVYAEDTQSNVAVQALTLLVLPSTNSPIIAPALGTNNTILSSNLFQMQLTGVIPGQNYTLLMATNLDSTNWIPIFVTNAPNTNNLILPDPNATNPSRFYRIMLGP